MTGEAKQGNADERLSANLRRLRTAAAISQAEMARLMREQGWPWHQSTIWRVESGKQAVTFGEAASLAAILRTTLDGLTQATPEADVAEKVLQVSASIESSADTVSEAVRILLAARASAEKMLSVTVGAEWPNVGALLEDLAEVVRKRTVEQAVREGARRYKERADEEENGTGAAGDDGA